MYPQTIGYPQIIIGEFIFSWFEINRGSENFCVIRETYFLIIKKIFSHEVDSENYFLVIQKIIFSRFKKLFSRDSENYFLAIQKIIFSQFEN